MEQILITGGAGFIGYHLAERLISDGNNVIIIDNLSSGNNIHPKAEFIFGDITKDPIPKVDKIYNLACPASPKNYQKAPLKTLDTCYIGTKRILEMGTPTLHASTSEIYGDPLTHPQQERYYGNVNTMGPRSCYDEGKRIAETLCYHYNAALVRIFNTYGPDMHIDDGRVIPNFISQAISNQPITIYGDGTQTRSLCYITDTIDALIKAMDRQHKEPINIGNPNEITINQLAETIIELTNSKSEIIYLPLPQDDPQKRRPDITRAKNILNWEPKVSLKEGLMNIISGYEGAFRSQ